jgi:16S rRNA (cytosine967-C5)-methyltransferase
MSFVLRFLEKNLKFLSPEGPQAFGKKEARAQNLANNENFKSSNGPKGLKGLEEGSHHKKGGYGKRGQPKKAQAEQSRQNGRPETRVAKNARHLALAAIRAVDSGQRPEDVLEKGGRLLSARDRALAANLAYTALRHLRRLDYIIERRLSEKKRTPELVRDILRLGLAQLLFMDRIGDHAAVSESVILARELTPGREGLVNALLRGLIREKDSGQGLGIEVNDRGDEIGAYADGADTAGSDPDGADRGGSEEEILGRLSIFYSFPDWMTRGFYRELGLRETRELLRASNTPVPATLRINPKVMSREELKEKLPFASRYTPISPWGLIPENFQGRPESWPGFAQGAFFVQDEASQILGLICGEPLKALDVCAGLGGKSLSLLSLFPEMELLALDKDESKLAILKREARRLGLSRGLSLQRKEAMDLGKDLEDAFDLVLVDAPCSGLGVIRRRPDLKWSKGPEDPARLAALQRSILQSASMAVGPRSLLVYGVCSLTQEEGPNIISDFLSRNGHFKPRELFPPQLSAAVDGPGQLRLWPHRHGTDGFFWAVMERDG